MAKTQTRTEVRNNSAKIDKLLRGIDNQTEQALKDQKKLETRWSEIAKAASEVKTLVSGLTTTAAVGASVASQPQKPAAKPTPKPAAKPATAATKTGGAPKKVAVKKNAAAAKPQKGQGSTKKPAGKAVTSASPTDRKPLKGVAIKVLQDLGPLKAADIYKEVVRREGYYSKQSLYVTLKGDSFKKDGEVYSVAADVPKSTTRATNDDEAESFVSQVDKTTAVSAVV